MNEYIKRENVMEKFTDHVKRSNNSDFAPTPTWNQAVQIVEDAPAADVVEVILCKDCRYSRKPNRYDRDENAACEGVLICCVGFDHIYPSAYDGLIFTDENDYCSSGVRKDGAADETV